MFIHSVAVQEQAVAADGVVTYDLAVNPLSVVLLCLRPLNETSTLSNFQSYLGVCQALNRVSVVYRGESIYSLSGIDLAALNYFRWGIVPPQCQHDDADNERRCVVLPLIMGRYPYETTSCFPASRRGELILELDFDIADTGYDGMRFSAETIELPGAKPKAYERVVTTTQTFAATGNNDIDVPVGNDIRGILLFGTTSFAGASPAPTLGRLSTMLDNSQTGFSATDFEVAHTLTSLWGRQPPSMDGHTHRVDATAAVTTQETDGKAINVGLGYENYAFLDFDPTGDDRHVLKTRGASRFSVRSDAEAAELVRAMPVEVIRV